MTRTPDPLVFDIHEETSVEDGGQAVTIELQGEDPEVYVRIVSWDENPKRAHASLAPFRANPDNLRVTLEVVHPPITGRPGELDDPSLSIAREQACAALGDLHAALARARDPRRTTPEAVIDLARLEIVDGERRLEEIDAEISRRLTLSRERQTR